MEAVKQTTQGRDILVLTDFSESSYIALKYAVSVAATTNSTIHVCHIGNPTQIVQTDNQVAALREIEAQSKRIKEKLEAIAEIIAFEGVKVIKHYLVGNIDDELNTLADWLNPELVVVGRKKAARFSGKLSNYLLYKYRGSLLIVGEEGVFRTETKIALACDEHTLFRYEPDHLYAIDQYTKFPLIMVRVKTGAQVHEDIVLPEKWRTHYTVNLNVRFVSEEDNSVADGLTKQISDKQIELLCIGKGKQRNRIGSLFYGKRSNFSEIVNNVQIPLLVMGNNKENHKLTKYRP